MEEIKLLIGLETRGSIKDTLANFTTVLTSQETTKGKLKELQERSEKLIARLIKLRRFKLKQSLARRTVGKGVARKSVGVTGPSCFEIDYNLKSELVTLLQKNLDCTIRFSDDISDEMKKELIDENGQLIKELSNLNRLEHWMVVPDKILNVPRRNLKPIDSSSSSQGLFWLWKRLPLTRNWTFLSPNRWKQSKL